MAKKRSTETAENAAVNQESKEPKKKQEDILLEMIQRYRISHTKNGIFIHIPKTNGKLEAYNLNDSRLKIKLKSMFKDEVGEFPPDAVIQNCLQYTESHAMELPLEEVKYRIASRDKSVMPNSAKVVGNPISLINAARVSTPASANCCSVLPAGSMSQTFRAKRAKRAVPTLHR